MLKLGKCNKESQREKFVLSQEFQPEKGKYSRGKKGGRRWLAWIVSLSMIVSAFAALPMTAQAAGGAGIDVSAASISISAGDTLYYGRYPQTSLGTTQPTVGTEGVDWVKSRCEYDTGGFYSETDYYFAIEPIEWRVLESNDDKVFLVSEKTLDVKPYHTSSGSRTWATSSIREWLNGDFLNAAFNSAERTAVELTNVINAANPIYNTPGGSNTIDRIFMLSIGEAESKLNNATRIAVITGYAASKGNEWSTAEGEDDMWWLRSPGAFDHSAALVWSGGDIVNEGYMVESNFSVRPAFVLDLSKADQTAPVLSSGSVDRTSDENATIDFSTNEAGTAYYLVKNSGASVPDKTAVKNGTLIGSLVSGSVSGKAITLSAGAKDIYVVVEDASGNISEPLKIEAAAYSASDTTAPVLSSGTVNRTSDTDATIGFTTDEAGTAYYLVQGSGDTAPARSAVKAGTSLGSVSGAVSGQSVVLTAGAKDIYVVVEDASGNISEPLKIEAAVYSASDTTAPVLSSGTVNRTSDTDATIGFFTNEAGNAYYLVQNSGDAAPNNTTVKAGAALGSFPEDYTNGNAVTLSAGAKDIYVVVEDAAGNISAPLKIVAEAYGAPDTIAPELSSGTVNRTSNTEATIGFLTNENGTAYYLVQNGGDAVPDKTAVINGTYIGDFVSGYVSGKPVTLTAGAKDIYVVMRDAAGNISDPLKIEAAAYGAFDTIAPILTSGSAIRTSDIGANIDFTTDEAGAAYYLVRNKGIAIPNKTAVRNGTYLGAFVSGPVSDKPVTLTEGAKDIYVIMEDAAGNTSEPLKIAVEPYVDKEKESDVKVTGIAISDTPTQFSYKASGKDNTVKLTATVSPENARDKTVTWSSSNTGLASVDANGLVTFKNSEGFVTITAIAKGGNDVEASKGIKVVKNVTAIRTPLTAYYIQKGKKLTLPIALDDSTAPKLTITSKLKFKSSNTKALTVSAKGVMKAGKKIKKKTTVKVTVTAENGKNMVIKVYVVPKAKKLKKFKITGAPKKLKLGQIKQLKFKLTAKTATNLNVTFKSSKSSVISVDKAGKLVAKKKGKAVITVKMGGKTVKTKKITVK